MPIKTPKVIYRSESYLDGISHSETTVALLSDDSDAPLGRIENTHSFSDNSGGKEQLDVTCYSTYLTSEPGDTADDTETWMEFEIRQLNDDGTKVLGFPMPVSLTSLTKLLDALGYELRQKES